MSSLISTLLVFSVFRFPVLLLTPRFSKCLLHTNVVAQRGCVLKWRHTARRPESIATLSFNSSTSPFTVVTIVWDRVLCSLGWSQTWYSVWLVSSVLLSLPPKRWDCRAPPHLIYGFHYFLSAHSDPVPCTKDILYGIHCVKGSCGRCWGNLRKHI